MAEQILIHGVEKDTKYYLPLSSVTKQSFFDFEYLLFEYVTPVPESVKRKLTLNESRMGRLNTPRVFASLRIYPIQKNTFVDEYIQKTVNNKEILPFFNKYLDAQTGQLLPSAVTPKGFCSFAVYLGFYTKEYNGNLLNPANNRKSTFTTLPSDLRQDAVREFKPLKGKEALPDYPQTDLFFLHETAGHDLKTYVESLLENVGFDVVLLYAANMTLAHKVYRDYYPMWHSSSEFGIQMNARGEIQIRGDLRKKPEQATCNNTHGPALFKLLGKPTPKYDWKQLETLCSQTKDRYKKTRRVQRKQRSRH